MYGAGVNPELLVAMVPHQLAAPPQVVSKRLGLRYGMTFVSDVVSSSVVSIVHVSYFSIFVAFSTTVVPVKVLLNGASQTPPQRPRETASIRYWSLLLRLVLMRSALSRIEYCVVRDGLSVLTERTFVEFQAV
jgi:hypothetical protein